MILYNWRVGQGKDDGRDRYKREGGQGQGLWRWKDHRRYADSAYDHSQENGLHGGAGRDGGDAGGAADSHVRYQGPAELVFRRAAFAEGLQQAGGGARFDGGMGFEQDALGPPRYEIVQFVEQWREDAEAGWKRQRELLGAGGVVEGRGAAAAEGF